VAVAIVSLAFGLVYGLLVSGQMLHRFEVESERGRKKNQLI
jgi:hypothetical protein